MKFRCRRGDALASEGVEDAADEVVAAAGRIALRCSGASVAGDFSTDG
ncbi:MAG: hypothetical protein ACI8W8_000467 [Rhodothermales bacterium]|jgi:hypothetical protein